jgi:hypothetical protein
VKVLVDSFLDWESALYQIDPETSADDRKVAESEMAVLNAFEETTEDLEKQPLPAHTAEQWDELNTKLLSQLTIDVDGEEWLGIVLPDFPMNETTTVDWKPIVLDMYAEVLTAIRDRNLPAILLFVVNRDQLLRTDTNQPSQQFLNGKRGWTCEWSHNFVCWTTHSLFQLLLICLLNSASRSRCLQLVGDSRW